VRIRRLVENLLEQLLAAKVVCEELVSQRDLAQELLEESNALQAPSADALAYGTAADWMVRCPLDFN